MRVIETVSLRRRGILFEIQFYRCISLATARNRCKKIRFFGTMKRVRVHEAAPLLARQQLFSPLSFPVFFPHPFFFLSSPLLSTPLLSLPALFPHPRTGDAKYTICIASSRKNSGAAFVRTTVGEARRGPRVSRLRRQPSESKTNVLAITAFVAEQQPFRPPLLLAGKTGARPENSFIR